MKKAPSSRGFCVKDVLCNAMRCSRQYPFATGERLTDFQATLLHLLGIDHERLTYKYQGRRFRLTDVHGHVVEEILA